MKRILFTIYLALLAGYSVAQETLSLGQCLQMGIDRNLNSLIGVAILVWGIVEVVCLFMDYKSNEKSDDAQVEQYISPVNMRASGYIKKIYFKEHQDVKKGDTLLVLDDREYMPASSWQA